MNTGTRIKGRIAVLSMTVALAVASLCSAASALPPIVHGTVAPAVDLVRVTAPPCSAQKTAEVRAPATASAPAVSVDCSLTLAPGDVVTKKLLFEGNRADGVTVECNGATVDAKGFNPNEPFAWVQIYSTEYQDPATGEWRWARPENVTLRRCNIVGHVSVWGASWGVPNTSPEFPVFMRNNAPRNIVLDDVTIAARGCSETGRKSPFGGACVPLYIFSGVSDFQMLDSEIHGEIYGPAVYLDAESYHNTFRDNYIHAKTSDREEMAIDGSSHNVIINNLFSGLENGGVYLYRNCGEGGGIRHTTPSYNQLINNVFYYKHYRGDNPAIFVAQRNGKHSKSYTCDDDAGYPFGSSASNYDHAQYNVVMQNQILSRSVGDMIKVGRPDINTPNYIAYNEGSLTNAYVREAGCYVSSGYKNFIQDGQSIDLFRSGTGEPICRGESRGDSGRGLAGIPAVGAVTNSDRYTCDDGVLSAGTTSSCQVSYVPFECQATENNSGCQATAFCPAGKKVVGGRAACNLEFGTVSSTDVSAVPLDAFGGPIADFVKVVRASDKVSDGSCTLWSTSIQSGAAPFRSFNGQSSVSFGCRERDSNGGDCHIKGTLYCQ